MTSQAFVFIGETPLFILVPPRLMWDPFSQVNPFRNGHCIAFVTNRVLRMGVAWLRQVYTHMRLWWLPELVRWWLRHPYMHTALQRGLGSDRTVEDMLLLMRRMHEVVSTEADWARVPWRSCTSPRLDDPEGFDVGHVGPGGDFLLFNPWRDTVLHLFQIFVLKEKGNQGFGLLIFRFPNCVVARRI